MDAKAAATLNLARIEAAKIRYSTSSGTMIESISPNTKIAQYTIVSKIGEGGMGEVYRAQDTKLDRKVALKILPADLASNRDRMDRFVREAKSAAALSHPNIAQIFEIGEHDGTHFIAMEFVDGFTLRQLLSLIPAVGLKYSLAEGKSIKEYSLER